VVFLQTPAALADFKQGKIKGSAQASAVALNAAGQALAQSAARAAPQAAIYVVTTIGLATALFLWWWAERGWSV